MRVGITVSTLGHLAILGFGFIAFPDAEPFQAEKIEALPIDLVTIAEFTDLAEGNKRAEIAPEEKSPAEAAGSSGGAGAATCREAGRAAGPGGPPADPAAATPAGAGGRTRA